jgi:hypothetical protein
VVRTKVGSQRRGDMVLILSSSSIAIAGQGCGYSRETGLVWAHEHCRREHLRDRHTKWNSVHPNRPLSPPAAQSAAPLPSRVITGGGLHVLTTVPLHACC